MGRKCTQCLGGGEVTDWADYSVKYTCPTCNGKGSLPQVTVHKSEEVKEMGIEEVKKLIMSRVEGLLYGTRFGQFRAKGSGDNIEITIDKLKDDSQVTINESATFTIKFL